MARQGTLPLFSVIIPARNEEKTLKATIDSILSQTEKNFEIIIVDDGSIDNTQNIALQKQEKDSRITMVISNSCGSSAAHARNQGAKEARGKYLLFHDADCIADSNLLWNAAKWFEDLDVDGIATRTTNIQPTTWTQSAVALQRKLRWENRYNDPQIKYLDKKSGINVAIMKRSCFNELNGYNENIFYFEDNDLTKRFFEKKYIAIFRQDCIQYHEDPKTLKESFNQCKNIAKGLKRKKKMTRREKITLNSSLIFLLCIIFGFVYPILFLVPVSIGLLLFCMICGKSKAYTKSFNFVDAFLLVLLYFTRNFAKLWFYFRVK